MIFPKVLSTKYYTILRHRNHNLETRNRILSVTYLNQLCVKAVLWSWESSCFVFLWGLVCLLLLYSSWSMEAQECTSCVRLLRSREDTTFIWTSQCIVSASPQQDYFLLEFCRCYKFLKSFTRFFFQFWKEELPVAMDRPDYGGPLAVPGLPHHGHPLPQLHRNHEAAAAGGNSRLRDPVPGHHRVQPLPGDGGTSNIHHWWRLRWREHRSEIQIFLQFRRLLSTICNICLIAVYDARVYGTANPVFYTEETGPATSAYSRPREELPPAYEELVVSHKHHTEHWQSCIWMSLLI